MWAATPSSAAGARSPGTPTTYRTPLRYYRYDAPGTVVVVDAGLLRVQFFNTKASQDLSPGTVVDGTTPVLRVQYYSTKATPDLPPGTVVVL